MADRKPNNFGFLRLLLAALVILSHSPELIDGNRSRELLTRVFGTLSFGEFAVDGFFLISGYLILKSWVCSRSSFEYLCKRVLRIYPGFIVAFVVSLCIGALAGGTNGKGAVAVIRKVACAGRLGVPSLYGAFKGLPYPMINGAMWTIAYEFRCYLLVMLLGALGVFRARRIYLALTAVLLIGLFRHSGFQLPPMVEFVAGNAQASIRFVSIFCCGGAFYLFRERISYTWTGAVMAVAALIPLMFVHRFAETAWVILGGYLLFWFAFEIKSARLSRIGGELDLSYGLYLYAWPIQSLLIWYYRNISPWTLFAISLAVSGLCAYASWTLIEKPFMQFKGRLSPGSQSRGVSLSPVAAPVRS